MTSVSKWKKLGEIAKRFASENNPLSEFYIEREKFEWEAVEGTKYGLKKRDDDYFPMLVRNLKSAKTLELRSDDVFVIGYPKSGTTWVEEIAWLLQNNLDYDKAQAIFHFVRVFYVDKGFSKAFLKEMDSPRVFKSHLLPKYLPDNLSEKAKVIYVMRNPKDTIVSAFNFLKSFKGDEFVGSFETIVDNFVKGKMWYGAWWKHIDEYLDDPNVLVVKYEELLENPIENIKVMCKFLGKNYSDTEIENLMEFCSFEHMKDSPSFNFNSLIKVGVFPKSFCFFKKGQIGNWQKYFTEELSRKVDEAVEKNLKHKVNFQYLPSS